MKKLKFRKILLIVALALYTAAINTILDYVIDSIPSEKDRVIASVAAVVIYIGHFITTVLPILTSAKDQ